MTKVYICYRNHVNKLMFNLDHDLTKENDISLKNSKMYKSP